MRIELKTPVIRKLIGQTVYVEREDLGYGCIKYLECEILAVMNRNVQFDKIDWLHFDEIRAIYSEIPE